MNSILSQTFQDWELVVLDSFSSDGSWEFLQSFAQKDSRIVLHRNAQKGIYINFNKCIQLARGEYVYFATSDDDMTRDCIEKMANALDQHPECGLSHCKLNIIDENGEPWIKSWDSFPCNVYFGDLIDKQHVRLAPHDGVLHFIGNTVYTSLTQIMIRKRLFDEIGMFPTEFGSFGDFEWALRATLIANTVHVPEYLAYWRVHKNQATHWGKLEDAKKTGVFIKMCIRAMNTAKKIKPENVRNLEMNRLLHFLKKERIHLQIRGKEKKWSRRFMKLKWIAIDPKLFLLWEKYRRNRIYFIGGHNEFLNQIIDRFNLRNNIKVCH